MCDGGDYSEGAPQDAAAEKNKKKQKADQPQASVGEVFSFVWELGPGNRLLFILGCLAGIGNGAVYPILAYLFSTSFSDIAGASEGLDNVRRLAFTFLIVGVYALAMGLIQTGFLEMVSNRAARAFREDWFDALLRQDAAFYDVYDISGLAASIQPNANKYQRGIGRKLGEGIQFSATCLGGIGFAFYSNWKVAFVILAVLPFVSLAAMGVLTINKTKGARASAAYSKAGSVAYSTVASIKTVLSLNAITEMISQYKEATLEAYNQSVRPLVKQGFAFGSMLGSFICLYCILTLFGTFLIYRDVEDTGCDPSSSGYGSSACSNDGASVFGAMLGVAFAAQGVSQVGSFFEIFTAARVAAYPAMQALRRKVGAPRQKLYVEEEDESAFQDKSVHMDAETGKRLKAVLPAYRIDSRSEEGLKPTSIQGQIEFKDVHFNYPTRPNASVLNGLNLMIEAGKTIALVGPSGGGKSTTVAMIERFYDPLAGCVELDGIDLKDINVKHLRSLIGYVGQEPTLFATTIGGNIKYGKPNATQEEIEAAARSANAHDFITSFPDGYNTQVGDKGAQLSGGQKQRIAIARVLIANPSILLLDEATSALDSESELVVQDALDSVVAETKRTTIVIAHRLSTIRNADRIAVIAGGKVVEQGTHDELMANPNGHYFSLVDKQDRRSSSMSSRTSSYTNLDKLDESTLEKGIMEANEIPHFEFRDVGFAYPTRPKKKVLDGFNLQIKSGETVALVGPSGGGKSTTVSLIERFYDVPQGSINYKGFDIRSLNVGWYRSQIGYVGQEPTLFNTTIVGNIRFGKQDATLEEIQEACKQANIHNTILSFPDGYETEVGDRGTQLSGGQKQRIAIARALVKKPKVLILDEATSALDTESEAIVQEALDKLMASKEHTTIVIAHRLSTIKGCDRIAFIAHGKVLEYGSHEELIERNGRYKRLVDSQNRSSSVTAAMLREHSDKMKGNEDEEDEKEKPDFKTEIEEAEKSSFSLKRARQMASPDVGYMLLGAIGAVFAGGVFPAWGVMFAETINLLFRVVPACNEDEIPSESIPFDTCQEFFDDIAEDMRNRSFELAGYWVIVALGCILGNCVTVWGFGMASERLNKRVRDSSFAALIRQEVAFFDKRSVGSITSQLQDDAARIHTFSGEPIRSFLIAISSLASGVVLSLVFMWPFALLAIGCIPLMGFATSLEMKQMLGEDEGSGDAGDQDELHSPGGILVETLLNIRTVAALNLQDQREKDFDRALTEAQPNFIRSCVLAGLTGGISMFIQQWINALQLWFGGWLLFTFPDQYGFNDFLISMFAILFSLFGLGAAFNGLSDRKQTEVSAGRVFYLLDRQSEIDPLSEEGKRLDGPSEFFRAPEKPKSNLNGKKSSVVRKTSDEFSC